MEINSTNALYPDIASGELTPFQFYREYKHGRPDVRDVGYYYPKTDAKPAEKPAAKPAEKTDVKTDTKPDVKTEVKKPRKTKLTEPMVRYIRTHYAAKGKTALAQMFGISTGFCYKVAKNKAMISVSDEGSLYNPDVV